MIGESAGKQRSSQQDPAVMSGRKDQFYNTQTVRGGGLADGEASGKSLRIANNSRNATNLMVEGVSVEARLTYQKYTSNVLM